MTESLREWMFKPQAARDSLDVLIRLLGKSPAGHEVARRHWVDMYMVEVDYGHVRPPVERSITTPTGRAGYLALASYAIEMNDRELFCNVCISAARYELERMPK